MANFLNIESTSSGLEKKVKQDFRFKTNNFVWRIKFNTPLDPKTVNNINLYVTTINQTPLKTSIKYDSMDNYIEIEPLEAYEKNESYILNITKNVKSKGGKNLKEMVKVQFKL
jgi:hypothetical protein